MQPQNLEVLAYEESPIGMICLRRREVPSAPGTSAFEITVDHQFLMSSLATDSERALPDRAVSSTAERTSACSSEVSVSATRRTQR